MYNEQGDNERPAMFYQCNKTPNNVYQSKPAINVVDTSNVSFSNSRAEIGSDTQTNANSLITATNPRNTRDNIDTDTNTSQNTISNPHRAIHKHTKPRKVTKLVGNRKVTVGNFKYKRKPTARK